MTFEAGLWTDSPDDTFDLCITAPRKHRSCATWTFDTPDPDQHHWRFGSVYCDVADVGTYSFSWRLRGVPIGTILPSYHARRSTKLVGACEGDLGASSTLGPEAATLYANHKSVIHYPLPRAAWLHQVEIYLYPSGTPGSETFQGVVYSDSLGAPGRLVASTDKLTFKSSYGAGWADMYFNPYVHVPAGHYFFGILTGGTSNVAGIRYENHPNTLATNANDFSAGPSDPFGPYGIYPQRWSLSVTYSYQRPRVRDCDDPPLTTEPC
jgi:hypothetical protein